ncbi:hypothetical protein [Archangium sp.]|nr:hypothetical protein [Archangium sp.]HYO52707.1 hypothetical protein [Archangium sp.]
MSLEEVQEIRRELAPLASRPEVRELRRRLIIAINRHQLEPPAMPGFMP